MGHPQYPPPYPYPSYPPPPRPARHGADVAVSVVCMLLAVVFGAAGAMVGLMMVAFLDHCPPATCSVEGAVSAVVGSVALAALAGLVGMVLTIIRLTTRKPGWPFAVGTLGAMGAVFVLGAIGYGAAVS